jgi:predicted DsbA family dithiol-disulfide isomerase
VKGADELWTNSMFEDEVRADEEMAQGLGITGVPSLLLDNKFMVVGAQGSEQILNVLRRAWARREVA